VDLDFPDEKIKLSELPKRPGEENKELGLKEEDEDGGAADAAQGSAGTADATNNPPAEVSHRQDRYIAPEMQSFTRVFRFGHELLVPTKIGDVPPKLFLLDTGAFNNAISPAAAREVTKVHNDDSIVRGISGSVKKVYSANKAVLQFGNVRQENQDMTAFDTGRISDEDGTEVSGFLGFVMLRFLDIKIDYRDALVNFTYDPKKWNQ
jgi:Aspartyl protease